MYDLDQIHTSSIPDKGLYYYRVVSFGIKNVEAAYQKMINTIFKVDMWKIIEVYIYDMVVKFKRHQGHAKHLQTIFIKLLQHNIRLNPL